MLASPLASPPSSAPATAMELTWGGMVSRISTGRPPKVAPKPAAPGCTVTRAAAFTLAKISVPMAGASPSRMIPASVVQLWNAPFPMVVRLAGSVMPGRLVQLWNAWLPMLVRLPGSVMRGRLVQLIKAPLPMTVTPAGMFIRASPVQSRKARGSMVVRLAGRRILFSPAQSRKASSPMTVTALPPMVAGITRGPEAAVSQSLMVRVVVSGKFTTKVRSFVSAAWSGNAAERRKRARRYCVGFFMPEYARCGGRRQGEIGGRARAVPPPGRVVGRKAVFQGPWVRGRCR